jgi:hypothetical protein
MAIDAPDTAPALTVTPAVAVDTGVGRASPAAVPDAVAADAVVDDSPRAVAEPTAVAVPWAPPPLVIDAPSSPRMDGAEWAAGFWNWNHGAWHWQAGEWAVAPQPGSHWVNPYYENRNARVIFIPGYWSVPGRTFVPPIPGLRLPLQAVLQDHTGIAPKGPNGVFIPAPPGSRPGVIVPAPIGTAPAVVTAAPPLASSGMRIAADIDTDLHVDDSVITMTEVQDVILQAPAAATLDHHPFRKAVPADAALAAALFPWAQYAPSARAAPVPQAAP